MWRDCVVRLRHYCQVPSPTGQSCLSTVQYIPIPTCVQANSETIDPNESESCRKRRERNVIYVVTEPGTPSPKKTNRNQTERDNRADE